MLKQGDLRVWWIPQVPMKSFDIDVESIEEGVKIMQVLAYYDMFQFENNIKPDYANAGGLIVWDLNSDGEGTPDWINWFDEETGCEDPEEYVKLKNKGEV